VHGVSLILFKCHSVFDILHISMSTICDQFFSELADVGFVVSIAEDAFTN